MYSFESVSTFFLSSHSPIPFAERLSSMKLVPVAKKVRAHDIRLFSIAIIKYLRLSIFIRNRNLFDL